MPGAVGNPPRILTPGRGPNGPGPIDCRLPEASVGARSSVPYGPTNGYATDGGVTGFIGPAAGSLRQPTSWYVRATGSNNNGGSSTGAAADRTGTDGATTSGSLTFTSVSAAFTPADIGKGICIQNATFCYAKITAINSATSVQLSNPPSATAGSLSWSIGGAWADPRPVLNCTSFANTTCGVQSGDTVYIGAGTYRFTHTLGANFGRSWQATGTLALFANAYFNGQVNIVGDTTGQYTGDAGMVQLSAYTTDDKTAPSASVLLTLSGKSNLAFRNVFFIGGSNTLVVSAAASQNVSFTDCAFLPGGNSNQPTFDITSAFARTLNWTIDRCLFQSGGINANGIISITCTTGVGFDYDVNFVVRNSIFFAGGTAGAIVLTASGVAANRGNGAKIISCTFVACRAITTSASNISTTIPSTVNNCLIYGGNGTALSAGASGHITENFNLIYASTPRTNVTAGANSVSDGSYSPLFHFGQERIYSSPLFKPHGEPMQSSPLLGFGNDGSQAVYDMLNLQRPAGGASALPAIGAMERHNNWITDTAPIGTGGSAIKITGPGDQAFIIPVPARSTTISVTVKWDANYAGTKPQIQIDALQAIGVTAETKTAVGSSGNNETLTLTAIVPTSAGHFVTVRVKSNDLTGAGVVQADDFAVST